MVTNCATVDFMKRIPGRFSLPKQRRDDNMVFRCHKEKASTDYEGHPLTGNKTDIIPLVLFTFSSLDAREPAVLIEFD